VPGAGVHVVWLKRDLRVHDHAPLARAVEAAGPGRVVALYCHEPTLLALPETDASHVVFFNQCLAELRRSLRSRGGELTVRVGDMPDALDALARELAGIDERLRIDWLWSHEETGLAATFERDKAVRRWADRSGVVWTELPQHGVVRPLSSRDGWARRWSRRMGEPEARAPERIETVPGLAGGEIPPPERLGLGRSGRGPTQRGGESVGLGVLGSFLDRRGVGYRTGMSSPNEGWAGCSRLSPYLAAGAVSLRRAHHETERRVAEVRALRDRGALEDARWPASLASFQKRLRWHCHFMQKLEDEPGIERRNFSRAFDGLREEDEGAWTGEQRDRFAAWLEGRTGYPMVDACMRCLAETGWINFRMRAMLVSFASYHLWLHWRPTARELARRFLDFEPGIHYAQVQMQSGTTGINTVRIYSPAKQARDQDPLGVFIRRWVPELEGVPDEHLPEPHRMPAMTQHMAGCSIGDDYPAPIVDHASAYRRAREAVHERRATSAARREASRVYERHGSRQRPASRR
jgi:deoxyribodipyrimidine photo-lyase